MLSSPHYGLQCNLLNLQQLLLFLHLQTFIQAIQHDKDKKLSRLLATKLDHELNDSLVSVETHQMFHHTGTSDKHRKQKKAIPKFPEPRDRWYKISGFHRTPNFPTFKCAYSFALPPIEFSFMQGVLAIEWY